MVLSLIAWLISLSICSPVPSMLLQKVGVPSFFLLSSIPLSPKSTSFLFHSSTHEHLDCFQHLAIVNSAGMNIGLCKFFRIGDLGFLGYMPSSGIAGSKGRSSFSCLRNSILFFTVAALLCTINRAPGFPFLLNLTCTCCFLICLQWPS